MSESNITKKALGASMKELMNTTPFSKISVGDICEKCGMSRKSFYYHFKDKYDLVNWIFYTEFVARVQERDYSNTWEFMEDICEYFYENRLFYINAFSIEGQNSFADFFAETLDPIAYAYLDDQIISDEFHSFYCSFFDDALRCAFVRWLKEHAKMSPSQFVSLCRGTIYGIAEHVMETDGEKTEERK